MTNSLNMPHMHRYHHAQDYPSAHSYFLDTSAEVFTALKRMITLGKATSAPKSERHPLLPCLWLLANSSLLGELLLPVLSSACGFTCRGNCWPREQKVQEEVFYYQSREKRTGRGLPIKLHQRGLRPCHRHVPLGQTPLVMPTGDALRRAGGQRVGTPGHLG